MGNSQSSSVQQTVSVVNQSMTTMVTKNTNKASATNRNANSFTIVVGGATLLSPASQWGPAVISPPGQLNCSVDISQSIKANQAVKLMAKFTSLADMKSQMTTSLQNSAASQSSSTQGSLAIAMNCQNNSQSINQSIKNIVDTKITNETLNAVNGFLDNANKGKLIVNGVLNCPPGKDKITINQSIVSDQLVTMLTSSLVGNTTSSTSESKAEAKTKQEQSSKQEGVFDGLSKLIDSIGMGFLGPIIACLLCVGVIAYFIFGRSSSSAAPSVPVSTFGKLFFGNKGRSPFRFGIRKR